MDIQSLDQKAQELARTFIQTEKELVSVLQQLDLERRYLLLGYSSLFDYCLRRLSFSESQSYAFVAVARKCVEVPALQKALDAGVLNVSKAKRILPVVDKQTDLWISKAASLPQRELEREVVQSQPRKFIRDSVRAVSSDQVEIRCEGSHALEQKLYRLREVLSRKMAKYPSLGEALDAAAEFFLEKIDPLRKAARVSVKSANSPSGKKSAQPPSGRLRANPRFIPAAVRHEVQLRDQGRCRFSTHGKRCTSRAFVDIHHVRPVSAGGTSSSSNLLTLCTSHHRAVHGLGALACGDQALRRVSKALEQRL